MAGYRVGVKRGARTASPNDQTAAASRATSLIRNWPGTPRAGNPPISSAQAPGVDHRLLHQSAIEAATAGEMGVVNRSAAIGSRPSGTSL